MTRPVPFPEDCIRGISNTDWLCEEGPASINMFQFNSGRDREDGWIEESINWHDDPNVVAYTLAQRNSKDTKAKFSVGAAILPRKVIDNLGKEGFSDNVRYERWSLPENPYHGNLLLHSETSKNLKTLIRARLAFGVSKIIKREE